MIDINDAIEEAKNKENISNGGSSCYDFGDVILVKYVLPTKYVKDGKRSRDCEEAVMEGINIKAQNGVNTPRHLDVERTVEGENDICYVLQEKCKGFNCASRYKYGVSYDKMIEDLEFVYNIPFEHYKKLISDGCQLYEMGYESKNKNLFYDTETGFWFIDFLKYEKDLSFDSANPKILFETIKFIIPKPIQIASSMDYDAKLTDEQIEKSTLLEYSIKAKNLLAIKTVIPNFEKYEKFYLFKEEQGFKKYLMDQEIIKKDLFKLEEEDYLVYDELYNNVVNNIVEKISTEGREFWYVETNDIRNDSNLFNLLEAWKLHKDNNSDINPNNYDDKYDYEYDLSKAFNKEVMNDILNRLKDKKSNNNIEKFLNNTPNNNSEPISK